LEPQKTCELHTTLGNILDKLPQNNLSKEEIRGLSFSDPNHPSLIVKGEALTDYFYDN
jgi:hypothetical protein